MSTTNEKGAHNHVEVAAAPATEHSTAPPSADAEIYQGDGAILVDLGSNNVELGGASALKLAKDGHTVLIPQPSDDPNDPLNWSWWKKHSILMTIGLCAFLADFQAGASVPCILPQAVQWNLTPNHVNYAGNLNVLMVAIGGVFAMPFLFFWGRAPLLFWVVLSGTLFTLGCTLAPTFNVYYAMKALQGFTLTAGQTSGLAFIQDMFFFHEHARKIGIWTALFLASPYFGPLFANFIIAGTQSWVNVYWLVFGIGCLNLVLMGLFLDETWYRRDIPSVSQPRKGNRLLRVVGIWQIRVHHGYFGTVAKSCQRMVSTFLKPIILPIMIYYLMNFMWAVGINQTSAILFATPIVAGGYGFSQKDVGYLLFAPIIGVVLGEVFGHYFNDFIAARHVRKHAGVFVPEARLTPIYVSAFFLVPGLILIGQALEHHLHWAAIVVGWGMFVFGAMVSSVAITAYALDSYPTAAGEVSSLINLARLLGGFSVGYFQLAWGQKDGYAVSFGVQAAIVAAGIAIIPVLHVYGGRMRHWGGPLTL